MNKFVVGILVYSILIMTSMNTFGQAFVKDAKAEADIKAVLDITANGWNTGDLSKYLFAYVPDATEMLSTGPTGGVEAIEKTMKEGFKLVDRNARRRYPWQDPAELRVEVGVGQQPSAADLQEECRVTDVCNAHA